MVMIVVRASSHGLSTESEHFGVGEGVSGGVSEGAFDEQCSGIVFACDVRLSKWAELHRR
jgi:hypothetical protein